ncbi:MAG: response regulator [Gemmatimonadota bacterium]
MQILIVDDEPTIAQFFTRLAHLRGHRDIDAAANGEEALGYVLRNTYDLITVDIRMPGVSGLEIIGMLRNMNPHAVIAVVSGFLPDRVSEEVAGCVDLMVPKPVSVQTFLQLLDGATLISETMERLRLLGTSPEPVRLGIRNAAGS